MSSRRIAVLGAGAAGLAASVHLARRGHRVTLFDRDDLDASGPAVSSWNWPRKGIPHFLQPHAFIPRGKAELRDHLPDVHDALLAAGAHEVDTTRKLPAGTARADGDDDLRFLAVRRPVIEWGLRRAVHGEARVEVRAGAAVAGLDEVDADLVVDAMGRRTPTLGWLPDRTHVDTSDCAVIYLCRYYRCKDGFEPPDGPWLLSPRGDLGYLGFATFPGDNRTFSALLAVPTGAPEWRGLRDADRFEQAVATIPALRSWVDLEGTEPITPVQPMAGLTNSLRHHEPALAPALFPVGDALGHTDPTLAHGLAFALMHARQVADALDEHHDVGDALGAFLERALPELRERYDLATALDEQRHRMWSGEAIDFTRPDGGAYELFSIVASGAAALVDADVLRVAVRRSGLLDRTSVLDDDAAMRDRIGEIFRSMLAGRPPSGPPRDEMAAIAAGLDSPFRSVKI